jgi:hypothetical protein
MGRYSKGFLAIAAAALAGVGSMAHAGEPTSDELREQMRQLQNRLDQLEQRSAASSEEQVQKTVERVLNDANDRSQLLQMEGFTAGYKGGKFLIQDAAGNWTLHPNFQFQLRNNTNWRHSDPITDTSGAIVGFDGEDDIQHGFEIRRMKLGFDGNAFNPNLSYYFLWATNRSGGGLSLEQAWVKYMFGDQWGMRAGQIRNPLIHEQDTSSSKQLAGDRSLTNTLITGTGEAFTQAVTAVYDAAPILAEIGVGDGFDTGNTDFRDSSAGNFDVFGRVNYFVHGTKSQYGDFTARGNKEDLLVIGGGVDFTQTGSTNNWLYTIDGQWENTGGLSVYVAYTGKLITESADGSDDVHNWGVIGQAGYMLNDAWEVFGRAGYSKFDNENSFGEDTWCELTGGVNWYIAGGHAAKITVDLTVLPNGSPRDDAGSGILASDDTEALLRAQFQLLL